MLKSTLTLSSRPSLPCIPCPPLLPLDISILHGGRHFFHSTFQGDINTPINGYIKFYCRHSSRATQLQGPRSRLEMLARRHPRPRLCLAPRCSRSTLAAGLLSNSPSYYFIFLILSHSLSPSFKTNFRGL